MDHLTSTLAAQRMAELRHEAAQHRLAAVARDRRRAARLALRAAALVQRSAALAARAERRMQSAPSPLA